MMIFKRILCDDQWTDPTILSAYKHIIFLNYGINQQMQRLPGCSSVVASRDRAHLEKTVSFLPISPWTLLKGLCYAAQRQARHTNRDQPMLAPGLNPQPLSASLAILPQIYTTPMPMSMF